MPSRSLTAMFSYALEIQHLLIYSKDNFIKCRNNFYTNVTGTTNHFRKL
jgi:hypothetical protein